MLSVAVVIGTLMSLTISSNSSSSISNIATIWLLDFDEIFLERKVTQGTFTSYLKIQQLVFDNKIFKVFYIKTGNTGKFGPGTWQS